MTNHQQLEKLIFQKGSELLQKSQSYHSAFFKKNWWYKKMLSWAMKDKKLKTRLLRFIDVLPSLKDNPQFLSHFKEYFKDQEIGFITSGLGRLAPSLMVRNIKKQIRQVAKMFIISSNTEEALKVLSKNWEQGLAFSMDILGETALSEEEAESYSREYLQLMDSLLSAQKNWPKRELIQKDSWGPIPSVNISVKASSLFSQIKTEAWEYSKEQIKNRLRPIFQKAVKDFVFVYMDMEKYHYKDLFLEVFKELTMEEELKHYPHFGIVIQAYLKESFEDLQKLSRFAESRKVPITLRLVKGAYWDSEVLLARQKNWPLPVYLKKEETEVNFEKCLSWLFKNPSKIKLAVGSHNIRSIACALAWHKLHPELPLEFQTLYGMGEGLAGSLRDEGQLSRLYCGMGEWLPGMSYLVRRLLENSSSQSFVLNSFVRDSSAEELLSPPQLPKDKPLKTNSPEKSLFKNHPLLDFSRRENIHRFQKALSDWKRRFPVEVPLIIEGERLKSEQVFNRENPSHPQEIISRSFLASIDQAERAVQIAHSFFSEWRHSSVSHRVSCLRKLSQLLRAREFELSALQVFEVGKTWGEAQADVAEAIDFCKYYALRYEEILLSKKTAEVSGEENWSRFEAIGPAVVIAPWNFPLAILTGMTVAPLLCGNTVLIKPAEQSALTAFELSQLLIKSGFPKQSFAFLPGRGEEVGRYLAEHNKVPIVSFTGSFEVGAQIIKSAGQIGEGQREFKKCIVEMGGKNAILIDSSADLDSAISGVLLSAFGFQGQKCSACSRLIVLEDIYESFMKRFVPAVRSLEIGPPEDPRFSLGPLIDKEAFQKIQNFKQREKSLKLVEGMASGGKGSWFSPPTVYLKGKESSPALTEEELFAPVLALSKAKNWESALREANQSLFGLTMALYSRHPGHIEEFKLLSEAGNVYINRPCTGAIVERHPFGGRKRSGLGSKAGGPDYLHQFLQTKIVTENSMRKGFAPEFF